MSAKQNVYGWDGAGWEKILVDGSGRLIVVTAAGVGIDTHCYGYNAGAWQRLRVGTPADAYATPTFALEVMSFLMGYDGGDWNMARVDAAGHLQVDVITAGSTASNCKGWDGGEWLPMLFEADDVQNLRVRLYDGATGIYAEDVTHFGPVLRRALHVLSSCYAYDLVNSAMLALIQTDPADNLANTRALQTIAMLHGWDGSAWDRLRTWGTGTLRVGRAEIDSTTVRKTVAGAVVAGAHNLYWISCSPDAPGAEFELTDAIAGGGAVVFDHFDPDKHSEVIHLDPPMKFSTGIWIEKFDHIHSLVFCYV